MKDQVDGLVACGVPAAAVNSTHAIEEKRQVARQVESGRLRLVLPRSIGVVETVPFSDESTVRSVFAELAA